MVAHLRTIAWLQFRLIKNSSSRNLRWLGAAAWVIQVVLSAIGCGFMTFMAFGVGFITADKEAVWMIIAILDGGVCLVLLVRTIMLSVELAEADFIDTGKLLFLPIRLRTLFGINFVVRNAGGIVFLVIPPLIGLCASLTIIHGPRMLLTLPLGLITLTAIVAWFGLFREWLSSLGDNRKRGLVTIAIVLVSTIIILALMGGVYAKIRTDATAPAGVSEEKLAALGEDAIDTSTNELDELQIRELLVRGNMWIPLGWFPLGVYGLAQHQYRVALFGSLGLAIIAAIGIGLEYRLVLLRYRSAHSGATAPKKKKVSPKSKWTQFTLPVLPREWSAFAGLAFLARTRTLTFKSSHWFYIIAAIVASLIAFTANVTPFHGQWWSNLTPYAAAAPIIFFTTAMSINIFGQDRTGFQVLVLMPVKRYMYILCKNIITIGFILAWFTMLMVPCALMFRPHPITILAAFLMVLQAQLALTVIGNGMSIAFPFRLKEGPLDQPAQPLAAILPSFLVMLTLPIVFGPMMAAALLGPIVGALWERDGVWVSLAAAIVFLALTVPVYALSIPAAAAFLEAREKRMLEILASDRE